MEGNIYKPRYKIAFLSKNKIWSYKDSRLRRFFNIRGRKLVRRGLFKRYVISLNTMKWTIARRYIRPYMRRRKSVKRKYKTAFYNKQQLRNFYGVCKEEAFRNFFKAHLSGITRRNDSFYSALERRADMFLFRTRLLPTIYAANQYVRHQGILLNYGLEKSPNALVRPGYVLTVQPEYWSIFARVLEQRLFYRWHGYGLLQERSFSRLKKKLRWISIRRKYSMLKERRLLRKLVRLRRELRSTKRIAISEYKNWLEEWGNHYETALEDLKGNKDLKDKSSTEYSPEVNNVVEEFYSLVKDSEITSSAIVFNKKSLSRKKMKSRLKIKTLKAKLIEKKREWKSLNKRKFLFKLQLQNSVLRRNKVRVLQLKNLSAKKQKDPKSYNKRALKLNKQTKSRTRLMFIKPRITQTIKGKLKRRWRGSESIFFRRITNLVKSYRQTLSFFGKLKFMEIQHKISLGEKALEKSNSKRLKHISEGLKSLREKYVRSIKRELRSADEELNEYTENLIKKRVRYHRWKQWIFFNRMTRKIEKKSARKTPLYYFMIRKRRKARRRVSVPRLKGVHWYTPSYIHFDFKTMQSIFLHHPLSREIHYSFKGSLGKLQAYYSSKN